MIQTKALHKASTYDNIILVPIKDLNQHTLVKYYVKPLEKLGFLKASLLFMTLEHNNQGRSTAGMRHSWFASAGKMFDRYEAKRILCCDVDYFKYLTKTKITGSKPYGYPVLTSGSNRAAFLSVAAYKLHTQPRLKTYLDLSLKAFQHHAQGKAGIFSGNITGNIQYPVSLHKFKQCLDNLHEASAITFDIETFSLQVDKANLASIAFATNTSEGFAFNIDLRTLGPFRGNNHGTGARRLLHNFFLNYSGTLIAHNASYDIKVLIWEVFMEHPTDYRNMVKGLDIFFRDLEDTKILAYLATNATSGNDLSLKSLAYPFTGNYAKDIKHITSLKADTVLEYNAIDCLATWYVHDKYKPQIDKHHKKLYEELFLPSLKVITQMELVGMPMDMGEILNTQTTLEDVVNKATDAITVDKIDTAKLKKKIKTAADYPHVEFNPGSNKQLRMLLHEMLELPVMGKTPGGMASTDKKALKKLKTYTKSKKLTREYTLINHLLNLHEADKLLNTFIPAFKNKSSIKARWLYLQGSFNLGGTISGRLSSSEPNLQNIPSTGTKFAKHIKKCFQAPPLENNKGWILVGADFSSLEDRISALQTKDPNKLKVYTDGYDGHCLRAYAYFSDQMPDIDPTDVNSINSIETKYPKLRQDSKMPTFALTYGGTWSTLVKNGGFTPAEAKTIEKNYHKLYAVSNDWVNDQITQANIDGYVTRKALAYQVKKEIKSAGNALGQSYNLLNNRASNEFMDRVWDSPYRTKVLPFAHIHDSQYYMINASLSCLEWVNNNLIECMQWNKLPEIQHPSVGLEAQLEVYYPSMANAHKIPNNASRNKLRKIMNDIPN